MEVIKIILGWIFLIGGTPLLIYIYIKSVNRVPLTFGRVLSGITGTLLIITGVDVLGGTIIQGYLVYAGIACTICLVHIPFIIFSTIKEKKIGDAILISIGCLALVLFLIFGIWVVIEEKMYLMKAGRIDFIESITKKHNK